MTVLNTNALRRSLTLVAIHEHAGHFDTDHPKFPKAAKDLSSLITNARRVNDKIEPSHGSEREKLSYSLTATNAKLADLDSDPLTPV